MPTVVLVGTLDTKGREYAYLRDRLREQGVDVLLVDAGIVGEPLAAPDVTRRGGRARRRAPTSPPSRRRATAAPRSRRWRAAPRRS